MCGQAGGLLGPLGPAAQRVREGLTLPCREGGWGGEGRGEKGRGGGGGGREGEGRGSGMALATMRLASPPQKEVYPRLCSAVQTANSTVHLEVIGGRRTLEREEVCSGAGLRQTRT